MQIELSSSGNTAGSHQGNFPVCRSFCERDAALCFLLLPVHLKERKISESTSSRATDEVHRRSP